MGIAVSSGQFISAKKFDLNSTGSQSIPKNLNNEVHRYTGTTLNDFNYGKSLIRNTNISFTGITPKDSTEKLSPSFSTKVNVAIQELTEDGVILMGKDFDSAKKELIENMSMIPRVIKNLVFIESKKSTRNSAIYKNEIGVNEFMNLSDDYATIIGLEIGKKPINLAKGQSHFISDGQRIFANGESVVVSSEPIENNYEILKNNMKNYDLGSYSKRSIENLNIRNVMSLNPNGKIEGKKKVTFADIGGQDEAIAEIKEKIYYPIKNPNFFKNINSSKSALFVGPPGNAKTLTAEALANELGIPFYNMNGQLLEGSLVGESAEKIHAYYEMVKENQPCILFFDEIDAILGQRTGKHKYADDSVNMHLDEISKLEKEGAEVFLLGATNKPHLIDDAALRSKRFGTKIEFKNPNLEGCKTIFKIHTRTANVEGLDVDDFAQKLFAANMSGADIAEIVDDANMASIKRQGIFEQMAKGTFKDSPHFKLVLIPEDFDSALAKKIKDKKIIEEYETKQKVNRKDEIKDELTARNEAQKEIFETEKKKPMRKVGFDSDLYKK